jgi:hypothetical protein
MKGSVSQNKENGMYLAVVYHDDSDISAITCNLPKEYHQFMGVEKVTTKKVSDQNY